MESHGKRDGFIIGIIYENNILNFRAYDFSGLFVAKTRSSSQLSQRSSASSVRCSPEDRREVADLFDGDENESPVLQLEEVPSTTKDSLKDLGDDDQILQEEETMTMTAVSQTPHESVIDLTTSTPEKSSEKKKESRDDGRPFSDFSSAFFRTVQKGGNWLSSRLSSRRSYPPFSGSAAANTKADHQQQTLLTSS